jgi:hypothetical protein
MPAAGGFGSITPDVLKGKTLSMNKLITRIALWTVAIGLLIALIVPSTLAGQFAVKGVVVGIIALAVLSVSELIGVLTLTIPDRPVDDDWTDDLVDGTATDLIDWED